jgi:hypothetical protein
MHGNVENKNEKRNKQHSTAKPKKRAESTGDETTCNKPDKR